MALLEADGMQQSIAAVLSDWALLHQTRGHTNEAANAFERAISLLPPGQPRARVLCNLAALEWKTGRKAETGARLQMALQEMEPAVGRDHPDVGRVLEEYSQFLRNAGRRAEARPMDARAREIRSAFRSQTNSRSDTVDWRDLKFIP